MIIRKRLIGERRPSVDRSRASTIRVKEVAALDHESLDDTVKFGALVALWDAKGRARFTGAELAEVLTGFGKGGGEEMHFYPAERFAAESEVEENDGLGLAWFGDGRDGCHSERGP